MIAEISAGLSSAKAAYDLAKGLNAAITEVDLLQIKADLLRAIIETQSALLSSQEAQSAGADRIRALKAEVRNLQDWNVQVDQYGLYDAGQGTVAYKKRPESGGTQDSPWYCPTCFGDRKLTLLQPVKHAGMATTLDCPRCATTLLTRGRSDFLPTGRKR